MLLAFLAVVAGLVLLIWSAEKFIDGAAATSRWLGLSPLLIGMLVIGFGTSAPEMMVSVLAAMQGNPGLAVGNAYGSNIANMGLVLGFVALMAPLAVHSSVIRKEMPLLVIVMLVTGYMLLDGWISRIEAALLLVGLGVFITASIISSRGQQDDPLMAEVTESLDSKPMSRGKSIMWTLIGLVLLIASSRLLVWGAVEIAVGFGVSDLIIGLTVVAVGTSLPELASSISALRRNEHDMVLGNVVGSNLFNSMAVVGLAGVIVPIEAGREVLVRDWGVMTVMTLIMVLFAFSWRGRPRRINRVEGGVLFSMFIAYTAYMVSVVVMS
ncbi:calcium/sodium antiporter [Halomonas sp. CnH100-B]|uniref:calcium/sodium antiporter n=1 Tax=Halomonadaceae TaxID=28256 RepID=UPI000E971BAC|nr:MULTISPECIES: calcium/sodium antiporter [Halomonas]MCO7230009.1 calcium/sodium antiporter [Halomonas sp. CnH100-B]MDK9688783.1 calcium/sodium antiporter [Halomonas sp. LC1]MDP4558269.1 calcium/sodium antiporter [Halomonas meridiana]HBM28357.1 calcium/sodium antiporter [Halomonas sp.]|tara:strand:- start:64 stop:1038 length:975 start_codon:yes stop_codon:yes gene_type:complete